MDYKIILSTVMYYIGSKLLGRDIKERIHIQSSIEKST